MDTFVNTFLGEVNTMNTLYAYTTHMGVVKVFIVFTNRLKVFTELCTEPITRFFIGDLNCIEFVCHGHHDGVGGRA